MIILNLKFDLTVYIDFQQIYDDPTVIFESKSNIIIIIKSQWFFDNLITILISIFFINTPKIIQFIYKSIHLHLCSI